MGSTREPRMSVIMYGRLHKDHRCFPVRIRNLSCRGARIATKLKVSAGEPVYFEIGAFGIRATIAWAHEGGVGIEFSEAVNVVTLQEGAGAAAAFESAAARTGWLTDRPDPYDDTPRDGRRGAVRGFGRM